MTTCGSKEWNWSETSRRVLVVLLVCGTYHLGGLIGLYLRLDPTKMTAIWPPNAILLAVLLLTPVRTWWIYILALLPIHMHLLSMVRTDAPPAVMLCHFGGGVSQSILAALGVRLFVGFPPRLDDLRSMSAFMVFAAILAPTVAAAGVACVYVLLDWNSQFWASWQARVLTNVFPTLTITPLIVHFASSRLSPGKKAPLRLPMEYVLLSIGLLVLLAPAYGWKYEPTTQHALMVAPLPLLVCTAVRFGSKGLCPQLLVVAIAALGAAKLGRGPFASESSGESMLAVQLFLLVIAVPLLMLTAMVEERNRSVKALRESTNRLLMATAAGRVGVWDWNLESNEIYVDPMLKSILGFQDHEIRNHIDDWGRHVHVEDVDFVMDKVRQHVNGESFLYEAEHRMVHRDGSVRWFLARGAAVDHRNGKAVRMIGTDTDITERKQVEDALHQNEARYRAIVEDQTELICRFLPDGTYTFVNDAYCRYFQRTAEELLGRTFWMFIPPEVQERARAFLASITVDNPVGTQEHEVLAPGGEIRWQQWRDRAFFDEHGKIVEFQAVGRDITDVKRAEEEHRQLQAQKQVEATLRESEARFRQLADSMPQIAWTARSDGAIDYFNRKWYEITNAAEGITGTEAWLPVLHVEDRQMCVDRWAEAVRTGQQYQCEARFLCGSAGNYRWHLTRALPLVDWDGRILRWYGTCTDIDDQKRAGQELVEADRRKDEFLAMLAHELRNPLAPIKVAVEIMRRQSVPQDIAWSRDVIARQVTHLTRLVDDLLDVSRITRGMIKLNMAIVDVDSIIAQAVETSRPLIESRRQVLSLDIQQSSLQVLGDAIRLSQVISNLLNNASKYTDEGGHIYLTVARNGPDVSLSVKDTGTGIPPEMLGRIFDLFVQVERSRERAQGGLGIGLTLVHRLVQMHGGIVEAHSAGLGQGSEFVVRLPLPIVEKQLPVSAISPVARASTSGLRILIVEDNLDLASTLSFLLSHHHVCVAHDGLAALDIVQVFEPDVVVLDIGLPKMDGYQVARRLRQEPREKQPLLIAMSGYGQEDDRRQAVEAGFDHHLVKPVDPAELESLLAGGVGEKSKRVPDAGPRLLAQVDARRE